MLSVRLALTYLLCKMLVLVKLPWISFVIYCSNYHCHTLSWTAANPSSWCGIHPNLCWCCRFWSAWTLQFCLWCHLYRTGVSSPTATEPLCCCNRIYVLLGFYPDTFGHLIDCCDLFKMNTFTSNLHKKKWVRSNYWTKFGIPSIQCGCIRDSHRLLISLLFTFCSNLRCSSNMWSHHYCPYFTEQP